VIRYENYGRKVSWNEKWYGHYERKVSWIVKWYGKDRRILWNDMENTQQRYIEQWKDRYYMEETPSSTVKRYGKYRRKVSWIVKR
jgi:hypothetical protein